MNANYTCQLLYISINSKGVEYDEGRRKARYSIEEAVARFPGADLALIISAHSAADGSLVHKVKETVNYCKSTPLGVSTYDDLLTCF